MDSHQLPTPSRPLFFCTALQAVSRSVRRTCLEKGGGRHTTQKGHRSRATRGNQDCTGSKITMTGKNLLAGASIRRWDVSRCPEENSAGGCVSAHHYRGTWQLPRSWLRWDARTWAGFGPHSRSTSTMPCRYCTLPPPPLNQRRPKSMPASWTWRRSHSPTIVPSREVAKELARNRTMIASDQISNHLGFQKQAPYLILIRAWCETQPQILLQIQQASRVHPII